MGCQEADGSVSTESGGAKEEEMWRSRRTLRYVGYYSVSVPAVAEISVKHGKT